MKRISDVERYRHDNSICPKKCFLGLSCVSETNGPFIDGRTTGIEPARGGFTIHCLDPLGYIRPYPRTGETKLQQVEASWQSFKQRGWAVHFIDLTELYNRLKIGAGRAVKAHLVDSERAASTYPYQNEKQQAELELEEASLYQRKPLRASPLYRVPNLRTPKLQAFFEAPTTWDI
ncbi:unnamed protein product [Withania somnifera]